MPPPAPPRIAPPRIASSRRRGDERARLAAALARQRRAIARDVHDGLAQELAFISAQLQRLELAARRDGAAPLDADLVRELRCASRRALHEARLTIDMLRSACDEPFGAQIERAVASFEARFGVAVELRLELAAGAAGERARRTALLRILGQALVNAVDHGGARRVAVSVRSDGGALRLRVADDGGGFARGRGAGRGWGIVSMRERAELLGGSFAIARRSCGGTEVAVELP